MVACLVVACASAKGPETEARYLAVHNTLAAMGLAQVGPAQRSSLAEGREARLKVDLGAQCTTIVALGGTGVRDVDLALLDPEDKPVAKDTTNDREAVIRACPEAAGRYTVVVKAAAGAGEIVVGTWSGLGQAPGTGARPAAAGVMAESSGGGTCESPILLAPGVVTGNTRRGSAEHAGTCASSESKELVYKLDLQARRRITIEVDPQFDSILYVRKEECAESDAEVACNDDHAPNGSGGNARGSSSSNANRGSRIDEVFDPGTYYVFVDGYQSEAGAFRMSVQTADVPTLAEACQRQRPLLVGTKAQATLTGAFDVAHGSCGSDAKGPDALYRFDLAARQRVRITERSSDFSPVIYLRKRCTDDQSESGCSDGGATKDEAAFTALLDPGAYTVFADSSDKDASGRFTLEAETTSETGAGVSGDACGDAKTIALTDRRIDGDTFDAHDDFAGKCGGQGAPDVMYRFELPRRARVTAKLDKEEGHHVFVLSRSCTDKTSELACGNKIDETLAPGVYYLAVDGTKKDDFGKFHFDFGVRDVAAQEAACKAPPPALVPGRTITASTQGAGDKFGASCAGRDDGRSTPDRVYALTLGARTKVRLALSTPTWDGVLALRRACLDPPTMRSSREVEVACNNDYQDNHHSRIETTLDAGTYWVVVDGHQTGNEGTFTLEYTQPK